MKSTVQEMQYLYLSSEHVRPLAGVPSLPWSQQSPLHTLPSPAPVSLSPLQLVSAHDQEPLPPTVLLMIPAVSDGPRPPLRV